MRHLVVIMVILIALFGSSYAVFASNITNSTNVSFFIAQNEENINGIMQAYTSNVSIGTATLTDYRTINDIKGEDDQKTSSLPISHDTRIPYKRDPSIGKDDNIPGKLNAAKFTSPPLVGDTVNSAIDTAGSYEFESQWGLRGTLDGLFDEPWGVAVDSLGNVYVADSLNDRIQKFSSTGTFLAKWGEYGTGDGQLISPTGIAVDSSGNVYVADSWNDRIQKFSSTGTFLAKWGEYGTGDGQFDVPLGIAVDSSGNVYVTDRYNYRVQKFSPSGTFITKWGSQGSEDGQFDAPMDVAVDISGNVYVTDKWNQRVQKFSSTGTFILKWGLDPSLSSGFNPMAIGVDTTGNVYVTDHFNSCTLKFSSTGTYITYFSYGVGFWSDGIALDSLGNLYVSDNENHCITKFSSTGEVIAKWPEEGKLYQPFGVAVDSSGNLYVADSGNDCIQKFSSSGIFITKWGSFGDEDGQFYTPEGVAVDSSGNVYVADTYHDRIQKFSSTGTFLTKWGEYGTGDGQFSHPVGIAVDSTCNVYVAETGNHRIQKFSSTGTFITKWGSQGSRDEQFSDVGPTGVAVDKSGNVYTVDPGGFIQKFSSTGTFIAKWGSDGQFSWPHGIAVDSVGNVYVADSFNDRIQKFTSTGVFITMWGSTGIGWGDFDRPTGIAIDSSGNVYVADQFNHLIQKFRYLNTLQPSEIGIYRPSTHTFYLDWNGNGRWDGGVTDRAFNFGLNGDIPVFGDWNSLGRTCIGVFRPTTHTFYLDWNGNGRWDGGVTDRAYNFGLNGDTPVSGDWDALGRTSIGVFRPSTHMFYLDWNGNGRWDGGVTDRAFNFGLNGDIPVFGDWNSLGRTCIGVFRPTTHTFYLDWNGNGRWDGGVTDRAYNFGLNGDTPVSGDWDALGRTSIGVFRPSTHMFYLDWNGNGRWDGGVTDRQYNFGLNGDKPLSGMWN